MTLSKQQITELSESELHQLKEDTEKLSDSISEEIKRREIKEKFNKPYGHCIIHWKSGGTSEAVFGYYHNGDSWFACANWTGKEGEMSVTSLLSYADNIIKIEPIRYNH